MTSLSIRLVMRSGPTPGQVYELVKDEVTLGRGTTNDIIIIDSEVSRKHARFFLQSGGYVIEDVGSTNGTYVDGQRLIGPHLIRPGEMIFLGEKISLEVEAIYDEDATIVPPPTVPSGQAVLPEEQIPAQPQPAPVTPPPPAQTYVVPQPQEAASHPPVDPYPPTQQAPAAQPVPVAQPVYSQQAPGGQYGSEPQYEDEKAQINWTWVFAGCGCMTIIAVVVVVALLFWIDAGGEARWCQYLGFFFPACP
jgi:pSer/pThr/pTyr-binding forkhead associated (FHA) protein